MDWRKGPCGAGKPGNGAVVREQQRSSLSVGKCRQRNGRRSNICQAAKWGESRRTNGVRCGYIAPALVGQPEQCKMFQQNQEKSCQVTSCHARPGFFARTLLVDQSCWLPALLSRRKIDNTFTIITEELRIAIISQLLVADE